MRLVPGIQKDDDYVVRETVFDVTIGADTIVGILREEKATGPLTFNFVDGGIRSIAISRRRKVLDPQREKIREILNIE